MDNFNKDNFTINTLTVHAGTFHSDDVFCAALAKIVNSKAVIRRVNKADTETNLSTGNIVADIGFGPFDHHQKDCPYREDGIKHCGASRLWLVFGMTVVRKLCPDLAEDNIEFVCRSIYNGILCTIAALDNGTADFPKETYSIVSIVESFRPEWDSDSTYDDKFMEAVAFMKQVLENEINKYAAETRVIPYVKACLDAKEGGLVILDKYCPWKAPVIADINAKVIVYPSLRGGWNLEPIPNEMEELTYRVHIPDQWRGKQGADAAKCQEGMTFCHAKGFVLSFETKEFAIQAGQKLIRP